VIDARADALARDERYAQTTNLVVLRGGDLVLDRHYGDGRADDLADIYSVTKTVVSTLVGIALGSGELDSLDRRVT
jgi:CubicO group peptidase (beta-lactamase class C family)